MAGGALAADKLKVGFVYVGPIGDFGYTYQHHLSAEAVKKEFGDQVEVTEVENVSEGPDAERVITQESPRGEMMYWRGSAGAAMDDSEGTDFHATSHGHMSVTPLKVDLTDHDNLGYWAQTAARLASASQAVLPAQGGAVQL